MNKVVLDGVSKNGEWVVVAHTRGGEDVPDTGPGYIFDKAVLNYVGSIVPDAQLVAEAGIQECPDDEYYSRYNQGMG